MESISILIGKLIPLYGLIVLGFIAGKFLKTQKEVIASLLIYIITPLVVFHGVVTAEISATFLLLPVIFFSVAAGLCLLFYYGTRTIFTDSTRNILAFSAGSGNTGYFGYPLIIALLGKEFLGIAVICNFGMIFFENTLGFFMAARGKHTISESIKKLLALPSLYGFILALILQALQVTGFTTNLNYASIATSFVSVYTVLGMMLVGIALSELKAWHIDAHFVTATFIAKFLFWPLLAWGLIYGDKTIFHLFPNIVHNVVFLMSIVPMANNTVSFASLLKVHPEKAAQAVFLSTLFALIYIPLMIQLVLE